MNRLLPVFLVIALGLLGATIYVATRDGSDVAIYNADHSPRAGDLRPRVNGIPGDRDDPLETIRTLTELQDKTLKEAERDRKANAQMRAELGARITDSVNDGIRSQLDTLQAKVDSATAEAEKRYADQIRTLQDELENAQSMLRQRTTDAIATVPKSVPPKGATQVAMLDKDTATDFGFDHLAMDENGFNSTQTTPLKPAIVSIKPLQPMSAGRGGADSAHGRSGTESVSNNPGLLRHVPNAMKRRLDDVTSTTRQVNTQTEDERSTANVVPSERQNRLDRRRGERGNPLNGTARGETAGARYTIPDGATLFSNTTMTALLGKVPIGGRVASPHRFKVITGSENLAANSQRLAKPVSRVIWTGYALGNREQSCVVANVDTVTLIFADGTISTTTTKQQNEVRVNERQYLGYLSDAWGKPCIRGQLYDNNTDHLRDRVGVAALAALAQATSAATTVIAKDATTGETATLVTDAGQFIAGASVAGAAQETLEFVKERALDAFDVVFVPTGRHVSIHVESEIRFDYIPGSRRLDHSEPQAALNTGGSGLD